MTLADNLRRIEERIDAARCRGGRGTAVTLVAVTKGRAPELILEALEAGIAAIGENRVQEARAKWPEVAEAFTRHGTCRHMIGHLQRNKVGAALELFDVIQSVDSVPLARKISEAVAEGRRVPVLLELNAGEERTKFGFSPSALDREASSLAGLTGIEIEGLMTMAPAGADEGRLRRIFGGMRESLERLRTALPGHPLRHLSMGMSGDYEIAVEEGATMVRIGTALFTG